VDTRPNTKVWAKRKGIETKVEKEKRAYGHFVSGERRAFPLNRVGDWKDKIKLSS